MTNPDLIAQARSIGSRVSKGDAKAHAEGFLTIPPKGDKEYHHPGDDTGRLMCDAYAENGAVGAIDVLDAYHGAYNEVRRAHGLPEVGHDVLTYSLGAAASIRADHDQIEDMRAEWRARHGLS